MRNSINSILLIISILMVGLVETAFSDNKTIIIGAAIAQSGWMEAYDSQPMNAAKLAIQDINAKGGVLGRKLELVVADTKTDRAQGSKAGIEVIDKGAKIIIVSCDYDMGSPAAFVAQSRNIISISLCANDPKMGVQGLGTHAFSQVFAAQSGGYVLAEFAYKQGWHKAYSLLDTTIEFDKATCAGFNHRWRELAGEENFLGQDTFKNGDPSIASQITRIKALPSKPDVIHLCTYIPGGASAIRQIRAAGIDTPLVTSQAMDGDYWLNAVPNLSNFYVNGYMSIFGDEPIAERQAFLDRYVKTYGEKPATSNFISGYMLVLGYARAVELAGTDEPDAVLAEYNKFKNEDLFGIPFTFTPKMHIQLKWPLIMMEVQNGKHRSLGYYINEAVPPYDLLFKR
jgi:branched-chain amino acid transport system substrate-binding protein